MRICSVENCNKAVFGTDRNTGQGYCDRHQFKRTDKKGKAITKPTNNIMLPGPSAITETLLFRTIWEFSSKRSFLTGLWLREYVNTPLWPNLFAHVLPKGINKYPYFKFYAKNIVLLTPGEHALYDQSSEEARINYALDVEAKSGGKNTARWDLLKQLETELMAEYKKHFPTTNGMMIGYKYNIWEVQEVVGRLNKQFFDSLRR